MARERMVTRTIIKSQALTMIANTETGETTKQWIDVPGEFDTMKEVLKAVHGAVDSDTFTAVKVFEVKKEEVLYGMSEADFMRFAKVLPPRKDYSNKEEK